MIRKITLTDSEILMDYDDTDLYGPGVEMAIDELIAEYSSMVKKQIPRADQQSVWLAIRSLWIEKLLDVDMRLDSGTSVYGMSDTEEASKGNKLSSFNASGRKVSVSIPSKEDEINDSNNSDDDIETDEYFGALFNLKRNRFIHPDLYVALKSKLNSDDPAVVSQAKADIDRIKKIKMEGKRLYEE